MRQYDPSADSYGSWMDAVAALRAEFESLVAKGLTKEQAHEEMRRKRGRKMGERFARERLAPAQADLFAILAQRSAA